MWNFKKFKKNIAFIDSDKEYTYNNLLSLSSQINKKLIKKKNLIFILSDNSIGSVIGYVAFILNFHVPFVADSNINKHQLYKLIKLYNPDYIWSPTKKKLSLANFKLFYSILGYSLFKKKNCTVKLNSKLCLLASTSGSTSSPKFVRQSYANVKSNTKSIIKYLRINSKSVTITTMPMSYTFGQSILNTHLACGGKIILCNSSILQKNFWELFNKSNISFLYGVPYTFEILNKLKFFEKNQKALKVIAQAGGKISKYLQKKISKYSKKFQKKFFVMYGQAEATTRIAYLPQKLSGKKLGCIGKSISGGMMYLVDDEGYRINKTNCIGNLAYKGPNVCMGYAYNQSDLKKKNEWNGKLITGDLAIKDKNSFYYIVGRKKRFAKINGLSVNLDDIENFLSNKFNNVTFVVISNDLNIYIFYDCANKNFNYKISVCLKKILTVNNSLIKTIYVKNIPNLKSGKKNYLFFESKIKK